MILGYWILGIKAAVCTKEKHIFLLFSDGIYCITNNVLRIHKGIFIFLYDGCFVQEFILGATTRGHSGRKRVQC